LGEDSRKRSESQWETIPDQRVNHGEGPALHGGGTSKWDMRESLLRRAEVTGTPNAKGRPTKVSRGLLHVPFVVISKKKNKNPKRLHTSFYAAVFALRTQIVNENGLSREIREGIHNVKMLSL